MDYDALFKRRDAAARRIQDAANRIQAVAKGWYVRKQVQDQRNRQHMEERFQAVMDKHREKIAVLEAEKRALMAMPGSEMEEYEQKRMLAAVKVQAHWRGLVARRKLAQSPERLKREQAARRIQAAFKNVLRSRRSTAALASVASAATRAASPGGRPSPGALRQSGASVLMGSPQLRSPGTATSSPQKQQPAGAAAGDDRQATTRNVSVMGPRRYKELQTQVDGKLSAYVALAKSRGSRRQDPRVTEARLAVLLGEHNRTAAERLAAVHDRQRNLVMMDTLCVQLEQLRPLADLPADAAPQDFPRPARGSERAERAAQAHALSLAEAKIGNRWWTHLRALNTQAVQEALLAEEEERWEVMDARWRRKWREVEEQENRRPDIVEDSRGRSGMGAAAVKAAKEAAALQSKQEEYAARLARAATAVPLAAGSRAATAAAVVPPPQGAHPGPSAPAATT